MKWRLTPTGLPQHGCFQRHFIYNLLFQFKNFLFHLNLIYNVLVLLFKLNNLVTILNSQTTSQADGNVIAAHDRFAIDQELLLIRQVKSGDRRAFHNLYDKYCARVYGICFRLLGEVSVAEDATQEVFIQVWHKIDTFAEQSKFSTWLYTVATNLAISQYRKRNTWWSRFRSALPDESEEVGVMDVHFEHGLDAKIQRLPEQARMVFVLFAIEGYRHEEIATKLGIAAGSSKAQYHRARSLLKQWIAEDL